MGDEMFRKIGDQFRNFMMGRYGSDQLNVALLGLGLGLMLLGTIFGRSNPKAGVFIFLSYFPLFFCIFRMYSKNIPKRRKENTAFLSVFSRLKDREHRYFRCPQCRQTVRVPRGRGKINIRCPKCSHQFIKRS